MAVGTKLRIGRVVLFPNGDAVQAAYGSGTRVTATVTSTSTAEAALPEGARFVYVRATNAVWLRFGNTGMGAAAAGNDSLLFPAGEAAIPVPLDSSDVPLDYFRVLRATPEDCFVQIESIPHVDG